MTLDPDIIAQLTAELGPPNVLLEEENRRAYSQDNSQHQSLADCVAKAKTTEQVAAVVRLCNQYSIPITVRGRGTGTTGASVPIKQGLVLSLERMDRILHVDPANRVLVTEPGVTNEQVQQAAAAHGFFWPPDPGSSHECMVGGNLGCNAAGPRAVKYGTCRENTLGLVAVTGAGEIIKTGYYTTKGSVGYDLTRLLIGSEGTLAIITQANLKLTPLPEAKATLLAVYQDISAATLAVTRIMAQPIIPCALEFLDAKAIELIRIGCNLPLPKEAGALLIIEVDGAKDSLPKAQATLQDHAQNAGLLSIYTAQTADEIKALWAARKALSIALRKLAPKKISEDVIVPVANIPALLRGIEDIGQRYQIEIVNFGHAGNGNIHINLLIDPADPHKRCVTQTCLEAIFDQVIALKGSLSGEHGIGLEKRAFIHKEITAATRDLMQRIKTQFDPNYLLNPGKIF